MNDPTRQHRENDTRRQERGLQEGAMLSLSGENDPLLVTEKETTASTGNGTSSVVFTKKNGLLFFRTLYFLGGLSGAAWGRFGVIYYNTVRHLTRRQIGIIAGMMPLLSLAFQPLWGWAADALQSRKRVFVGIKVMEMGFLLSLMIPVSETYNYEAVLLSASGVAICSSVGILDAHTLDFLASIENQDLYGSIRLFASLSWGAGAVLMGYITDHFGFDWNFGVFVATMTTLLFFVSWGLPTRSQSEQARYSATENKERSHQHLDWSLLWGTLGQWQVLLWLSEVAVLGVGIAMSEVFLFVFLQNDLQASTVLCGATVGVSVVLEIFVFGNGQWLLRNVGHDGLFAASMVATIVRVWGYCILTPQTVNWVLLLEVLHGVAFGCQWVAAVDYSGIVSPEEWFTTIQTLLNATQSCLGTGLGSIVAGQIYQEFGALTMYRWGGFLMFVVLVVRLFLWRFGYGHDAFLSTIVKRKRIAAPECGSEKC